jgi:hypothetical protein
MPTTWTPEQNGNTGRMIFVDNVTLFVDSETYFSDGATVFMSDRIPVVNVEFEDSDVLFIDTHVRFSEPAPLWFTERVGSTGRMVFADNETLFVDDIVHLVDGSDVFTREVG